MAAKIITVFNQKGGVGKNTTACQLAGTLGYRGYDVLVADVDPQETTSSWLTNASEALPFPGTLWTGHKYAQGNVAKELGKLSDKYDLIIVDCAPSVDNASTWSSLLVSDLAIIPTKLSPADTTALPAALELAKKALHECGRNYPVRVLATAFRKSRADEKMMLEQISTNSRYPEFKVLPIQLGDRVAFTRSMLIGATAHNMPKAGEASAELDMLADEVCALLSIPAEKG